MNQKRIKIFTKGILPLKGNITGPILTPYMENVDTIFKLVAAGINVYEVLDNNNQVKLTIHNFDKDNNEFKPEKVVTDDETIPVTKDEIKVDEPATVEVTPEVVTETNEYTQPAEIPEEAVPSTETVEETTEETEDTTYNNNNGYTGYAQRNNKKKKKHHNNNGEIKTDEYTVE